MNVRLQAGILSYVLAISLLVSVGLSMLSLYVYYSLKAYATHRHGIALVQNLASARNIALGAWNQLEYDQQYRFDLYGQTTDSVLVKREKWGLLDLFSVVSFRGTRKLESHFFISHIPDERARSAVFLVDDGRPLSLVGDTRLTGDCYLPVAGVQTAYINRVGYINEKLLYGEQLKSEKELPKLGLDKDLYPGLSARTGEQLPMSGDTLRNSFSDSLAMVSGSTLHLNEVYQGKIFIKASQKIVFDSLSYTEDVLAFAPVIEFRKGFTGNGQFIATDTIIVHDSVKVTYPAALVVYNEDKPATIRLESRASVQGWIVMDGEEGGFRRRVVHLGDLATFKGMIFCNGLLETYGDIIGNVTVKRFLVNAPSAVYENYLLNAHIDATQLDSAFLVPSTWFFTPSARILKYLH